jgi:hypothetical protein
MKLVLPDEEDLRAFASGIFRYASDGVTVALRTFAEGDKSARALSSQAVQVNGAGLDAVIDAALSQANFAATHTKKAVFCPPLAGFADPRKADEANLAEAYTLTVECDRHPDKARRTLEGLLGPPTFVVASGGAWTDPQTGEVHDKLHLHWRLTEPATGDDLKQLKILRRLAADLVDADRSCVPVVHPIRWAGSVHRKGEPKLARIIAASEHEVDLDEALEALEDAKPSRSQAGSPRVIRFSFV